MKKMQVFYVMTANGHFVCGPFRDKRRAAQVAQDYSETPCWGPCHIEEAWIDDPQSKEE